MNQPYVLEMPSPEPPQPGMPSPAEPDPSPDDPREHAPVGDPPANPNVPNKRIAMPEVGGSTLLLFSGPLRRLGPNSP
jgi:hypothetical protein